MLCPAASSTLIVSTAVESATHPYHLSILTTSSIISIAKIVMTTATPSYSCLCLCYCLSSCLFFSVSAYNDPETRNGFYKSDSDDREEYFKKLHNATKEPSLKFQMREVKRMLDEEAAAKAKAAEDAK